MSFNKLIIKRRPDSSTLNKWMAYYIILAIIMRCASAPTANASYIAIAVYALFGRVQIIQALLLSWIFTMLNSGLVPDASSASLGRYFVIFFAAASLILRGINKKINKYVSKLNILTLFLGILLIVHSLIFSFVVDVSILKIISWLVVVLTLLSAWQGLTFAQRIVLFNQLYWGLIWLLLLSLPLLAVPSIGYMTNGTGFQGFLNHPQAFGPTVALVGALVGGRILEASKPRWLDIALLVLCLVLSILSEARTAGLAMLLGLTVSALLSPMFAGVSRRQMLPGLHSRRLKVAASVALIGAFATGPILIGTLSSYIFKRTDSTNLIQAADASRGDLVGKMILNIRNNLWTGIGFGIASNPLEMVVERDQLLGLPISALVEKGVMPVAVVEELGIVGALAVLSWIFLVLRRGARAGVPQFAVLITLLLVNFGESMLFSVGGMGMLLLILLTGAVTGERQKIKRVAHD